MPYHPAPTPPPRSTAILTVTAVISAIFALAYIGLFVLMALSAVSEIDTIERLQDLKAGGAQITNTDEDLRDSIDENKMAIVVFSVGAALTLPLAVASLIGIGGRGWARGVASAFLLPPAVTITFGVIHDIQDGHEENVYAMVFTIPAIALAVLWWLPATTRAMAAKRWRRAPGFQGPPPGQMPGQPVGWQGQQPYQPHR